MADISKINAVALADIAKLDAVLAANLAKVNGLVFTTAGIAAPAAAYSVRLLDSSVGVPTYTGAAMRVRRDTAGGTGDDDEADVAYDSNNILSLDSAISNASVGVTATTLGQFLNVGTVAGTTYTNPDSLTVTASCFVDEWKDQSGNANDATQATHGSQPQIHDGTVNTDLITENGKPAIDFDNFGSVLVAPNASSLQIIGDLFAHVVTAGVNETSLGPLFTKRVADNQREYELRFNSDTQVKYLDSANNKTYSISSSSNQRLFVLKRISNTSAQLFENGTSISTQALSGTQSITTAGLALGGREDGQFNLDGTLQEIVLWPSQQTGNRTAIEENINSEYLIYQPTDAPTSWTPCHIYRSRRRVFGEAAFGKHRSPCHEGPQGLRRCRRGTSASTANGDLDSAGIAAFCDAANGFVTRWWDQSTNGNHADQATDASQPQIYNGTAVITENGKPIIQRTV